MFIYLTPGEIFISEIIICYVIAQFFLFLYFNPQQLKSSQRLAGCKEVVHKRREPRWTMSADIATGGAQEDQSTHLDVVPSPAPPPPAPGGCVEEAPGARPGPLVFGLNPDDAAATGQTHLASSSQDADAVNAADQTKRQVGSTFLHHINHHKTRFKPSNLPLMTHTELELQFYFLPPGSSKTSEQDFNCEAVKLLLVKCCLFVCFQAPDRPYEVVQQQIEQIHTVLLEQNKLLTLLGTGQCWTAQVQIQRSLFVPEGSLKEQRAAHLVTRAAQYKQQFLYKVLKTND